MRATHPRCGATAPPSHAAQTFSRALTLPQPRSTSIQHIHHAQEFNFSRSSSSPCHCSSLTAPHTTAGAVFHPNPHVVGPSHVIKSPQHATSTGPHLSTSPTPPFLLLDRHCSALLHVHTAPLVDGTPFLTSPLSTPHGTPACAYASRSPANPAEPRHNQPPAHYQSTRHPYHWVPCALLLLTLLALTYMCILSLPPHAKSPPSVPAFAGFRRVRPVYPRSCSPPIPALNITHTA